MTIIILSIVITIAICNKINRNTVGTTMAYIKRAFVVWILVIAALSMLANYLGVI